MFKRSICLIIFLAIIILIAAYQVMALHQRSQILAIQSSSENFPVSLTSVSNADDDGNYIFRKLAENVDVWRFDKPPNIGRAWANVAYGTMDPSMNCITTRWMNFRALDVGDIIGVNSGELQFLGQARNDRLEGEMKTTGFDGSSWLIVSAAQPFQVPFVQTAAASPTVYSSASTQKAPARINLVFEGDSLTTGGYYELVASLTHLGNESRFISVATSGDRVHNMLGEAPSQVDAKISKDHKYNIAILLGGINDLATGASVLDVYEDIQTWAKYRKAAGFKVVLLTLTPCLNCGPYNESQRQLINEQLRAHYREYADALADVGNDVEIGNFSNTRNVTLFNDGLHMNSTGNRIMARYVAEEITRIAD